TIVEEGFVGDVYPINPKAEKIMELKSYPSILKVPGRIDLALIAVPASIVPKVLEECGEKEVKSVIVISGGFKEIGGEGVKLEEEVKKIARKHGMRLMGPNCIGVYDPYTKIDTLFLPREKALRPKKGGIAFISQSGALGVAFLDWLTMEDIGLSVFVSYGNKADVDEIDLMEYLMEDEKTKVITMYLEEISNGRRFMEMAMKVSEKKPIVAIKAGRTRAGARAVSSHTGSLAGREEIIEAAFKKAGIIRAYDTHELFDYARALATGRVAWGERIAIVTDGGGAGVMATDKLTDERRGVGLKLAKFKRKTEEELRKILPPFAITHNPVDLTGSATPEMYRQSLEIVAEDENVDGIVVIALIHPPGMNYKVLYAVEESYVKTEKSILVAATGGTPTQKVLLEFQERGIPSYPEVERAVKAMKALVERGKYLSRKE
ncbi:MAG TPA: CoA-binding protein, partial [Candidatus Bathyarchaeota archaeon]|nr:CoA-binding protein [Candidatus Bathyarchaeota archaeon]